MVRVSVVQWDASMVECIKRLVFDPSSRVSTRTGHRNHGCEAQQVRRLTYVITVQEKMPKQEKKKKESEARWGKEAGSRGR